jgi:hypothetical protein
MDSSTRIDRYEDGKLSCSQAPGARFKELAGDAHSFVTLAHSKPYLHRSALKQIARDPEGRISQVEFKQFYQDAGKTLAHAGDRPSRPMLNTSPSAAGLRDTPAPEPPRGTWKDSNPFLEPGRLSVTEPISAQNYHRSVRFPVGLMHFASEILGLPAVNGGFQEISDDGCMSHLAKSSIGAVDAAPNHPEP